jgi:alpha-glucosidase
MLTLHQRLIQLRQSEDALMAGSYARMHAAGDILAYSRRHNGDGFVVILNLGGEPQNVELDAADSGRIALSTHLDREGEEVSERIDLRPNEGVVIRLG